MFPDHIVINIDRDLEVEEEEPQPRGLVQRMMPKNTVQQEKQNLAWTVSAVGQWGTPFFQQPLVASLMTLGRVLSDDNIIIRAHIRRPYRMSRR